MSSIFFFEFFEENFMTFLLLDISTIDIHCEYDAYDTEVVVTIGSDRCE